MIGFFDRKRYPDFFILAETMTFWHYLLKRMRSQDSLTEKAKSPARGFLFVLAVAFILKCSAH
jgi:hypothetical protein